MPIVINCDSLRFHEQVLHTLQNVVVKRQHSQIEIFMGWVVFLQLSLV